MRRCESCNRPLRNPQSIELGFGPGCWSRLEPAQRNVVLARLSSRPGQTGVAAAANGSATSAVADHPPAASASAANGSATSAVAGRLPAASAAVAADSPALVASATRRSPAADGTGHPQPRPPQPSSSALAVLASWTVGLVLVLGLVRYWQWLLLGLGVVVAMGATGLLLERLQERRRAVAHSPASRRDPTRRREEAGPLPVPARGSSRPLPTPPGSS